MNKRRAPYPVGAGRRAAHHGTEALLDLGAKPERSL